MATSRTRESADRVADRILPQGGPADSEALAYAVDVAAELIRNANHLTRRPYRPEMPSDIDAIVAQLQALTAGIPQLCSQLAAQLDYRWRDDQRLYHDGMGGPRDPHVTLHEAVSRLSAASQLAQDVEYKLRQVHNLTARLGIRDQ